jgi:hypothetical protein
MVSTYILYESAEELTNLGNPYPPFFSVSDVVQIYTLNSIYQILLINFDLLAFI